MAAATPARLEAQPAAPDQEALESGAEGDCGRQQQSFRQRALRPRQVPRDDGERGQRPEPRPAAGGAEHAGQPGGLEENHVRDDGGGLHDADYASGSPRRNR